MALLSLLSCAVSSVVSSTSCRTDYEDTFYFEVFRFPGQIIGDEVYLRAKIIVCLSNNPTSDCQAECAACSGYPEMRERRDTLKEIQQTEFHVIAGPFKIRDPDQGLWLKNLCAKLRKGYQVDRINDFI